MVTGVLVGMQEFCGGFLGCEFGIGVAALKWKTAWHKSSYVTCVLSWGSVWRMLVFQVIVGKGESRTRKSVFF